MDFAYNDITAVVNKSLDNTPSTDAIAIWGADAQKYSRGREGRGVGFGGGGLGEEL